MLIQLKEKKMKRRGEVKYDERGWNTIGSGVDKEERWKKQRWMRKPVWVSVFFDVGDFVYIFLYFSSANSSDRWIDKYRALFLFEIHWTTLHFPNENLVISKAWRPNCLQLNYLTFLLMFPIKLSFSLRQKKNIIDWQIVDRWKTKQFSCWHYWKLPLLFMIKEFRIIIFFWMRSNKVYCFSVLSHFIFSLSQSWRFAINF